MLPALSPRGDSPQLGVLLGDTTITPIASPRTPSPLPIESKLDPGNAKIQGFKGYPQKKNGRPRRRASAPHIGQCMPTIGLDDFELNFKLGEGGGGTVWQCTKRDTGQNFAIKIVEKSSIVSVSSITRIVAERTIMTNLDSPFITKLFFAFQSATQVYLVLELVAGGDLLRLMRRFPQSRMSEDEARFYVSELVLAIEIIHSNHVSFRDLKPENVLVTADGHLKVADFGLATRGASIVGADEAFRSKTLCGTPEYMAPEMIKETGHGTLVDIWALGCMAYEFLQGCPPFTGAMQEMFVGVLSGTPTFKVPVSAAAADFINRLLHKDPAQRLGANGMHEIKEHAFLRSVDWHATERQTVEPPMCPRALDSQEQLETAALMARIQADFKPYSSPATSPASVRRLSPLVPGHGGNCGSAVALPVLDEAAFETTQALAVIDGTTHEIVHCDERLCHVTGLTYSCIINMHVSKVLAEDGDAKLLFGAFARVLLKSGDSDEHTESLAVRIVPSGQPAIVDLRPSLEFERGVLMRITRTGL